MNPELSRRLSTISHTWTLVLSPQDDQTRLLAASASASGFAQLPASQRALIILAEREQAAGPFDYLDYVPWRDSAPSNRPSYYAKNLKHNRPGDHPSGGYNPDWRSATRDQNLGYIKRYADDHGLSYDEYDGAVREKLQSALDGGQVQKRTHMATLGKILSSGRLKSQFETHTSSGTLDNGLRTLVETSLMGLPVDQPPAERPIYGYVSARNGERTGAIGYGDVALYFKDSVRDRTTVTFADSLSETNGGTFPSVCPQPLTNISTACHPFNEDPLGDPSEPYDLDSTAPYVEAQILGGVSVHDIARVEFLGEKPGAGITAGLDAAGIPYSITAPAGADLYESLARGARAVDFTTYDLLDPDGEVP